MTCRAVEDDAAQAIDLARRLPPASRNVLFRLATQLLDEATGNGARTRYSVLHGISRMSDGQLDKAITAFDAAGCAPDLPDPTCDGEQIVCNICTNTVCNSQKQWDDHCAGKKHKAAHMKLEKRRAEEQMQAAGRVSADGRRLQ